MKIFTKINVIFLCWFLAATVQSAIESVSTKESQLSASKESVQEKQEQSLQNEMAAENARDRSLKKKKKKKKKKRKRKGKRGRRRKSSKTTDGEEKGSNYLKTIKSKLPYPYANINKKLLKGVYYDEPEIQTSNQEKVQLIFSTDGAALNNPIFESDYNDDEAINYFRLTLPTFDPLKSRKEQISTYIDKWMDIDSRYENAGVEFDEVNNKETLNRVVVSYFNRRADISKDYYIDIEFLPEELDFSATTNAAESIDAPGMTNELYDHNFAFTMSADCKVIKKELQDPQFFECNPYVNAMGFVVPSVFTVDVELEGVLKNGVLFEVRQPPVGDADELMPDDMVMPTVHNSSLLEMILKKVNKLSGRNARKKKYILKALGTKEFIARISKFDDMIDDFEEKFESEIKDTDSGNTQVIKKLLWGKIKNDFNRIKEEKISYRQMQSYTKKINMYGITKGQNKVAHNRRNMSDIKTFFIRKKRYLGEDSYDKIYTYLDYMRYLKDFRIEKKYYNGFSTD